MKQSQEDRNLRHLKTKPRTRKAVLARNIAILFVSVVFLFAGVACVYAESMLGRINTVIDEQTAGDNPFQATSADSEPRDEDPLESGLEEEAGQISDGLKKVNGLWHDDSIVNLPFSIPFYGDHVSLFALLMAVSLFGYSYFNYQQTASSQPQMAGMKFMMVYMMPIMMLLWFNSYSSGLCYYYLLSNLFTIGQTLLIRRMVDDDKIHAVMQANAAKRSKGKKSKFQQRYEELLRQQEAQQRTKRK